VFVTREFGIRVTAADSWPLLTARRRSTSTIQLRRAGRGELRFVEPMPPGFPRSIALTTDYVDSQPGSVKEDQLNVENVDDVHTFLPDRVQHQVALAGRPAPIVRCEHRG
jgi:hypothetical protein